MIFGKDRRQRELMEELKRSESDAREQHLLFSSIFEGAPEAIVLTDLQRRIIMVNPAMTRIFGYEPRAEDPKDATEHATVVYTPNPARFVRQHRFDG